MRALTMTDPVFLALSLLMVFAALVPYPFVESFEVAGTPAIRLVTLAIGAALLPVIIKRGLPAWRGGSPAGYIAAAILAFTGVQLFGAIGSVEPVKSAAKVVFYAMTGAVFFFAAGVMDKGSVRRLLWLMLALSFAVGVVSAWEFLGGRVPVYYGQYLRNNPYFLYSDLKGRSFATLGHPVTLGCFFVLTVPAGFYLARTALGPASRIAAYLFTAASLCGLFFTFSRGAYLAAAVSAFVFFRGTAGWKKMALAVMVLAAVALLAGRSDKVMGVLERRNPFTEYVKNAETAHRLRAYELAGRVLSDVPLLGMGVGNYRALYDKYRAGGGDTRHTYATPDNMYLVTLAECGLVGLGLFAYILYGAFRGLRRAMSSAEGGSSAFYLMCFSVLAGFAVDMLFFDALYVDPIRALFWTILGLACAEAKRETAACQAP